MAFSKRKSGRGPLQRLSDQRRRVALVGLAIGAFFSASVFRRRRRHGEELMSFERPTPPGPRPGSEPADAGAGAAVDAPPAGPVEVPPAASASGADDPLPEPVDTADDEVAINAASPVASEAESAPSPSPTEPATGELSAEEASILAVLAQSGRADEDRTALAVAISLERGVPDVTAALRKLGAEGVVSGELYTSGGDKIWAVTERGVRRLGAQS